MFVAVAVRWWWWWRRWWWWSWWQQQQKEQEELFESMRSLQRKECQIKLMRSVVLFSLARVAALCMLIRLSSLIRYFLCSCRHSSYLWYGCASFYQSSISTTAVAVATTSLGFFSLLVPAWLPTAKQTEGASSHAEHDSHSASIDSGLMQSLP